MGMQGVVHMDGFDFVTQVFVSICKPGGHAAGAPAAGVATHLPVHVCPATHAGMLGGAGLRHILSIL